MKKLLSLAALLIAFSPLAQAQERSLGLTHHPEARNDRQVFEVAEQRRYVKRVRCRDGSYHKTCRRHGGVARRWRR